MLIGLTYDLRQDYLDVGYSAEDTAEFDSPETIDAIDDVLRSLGHQTDRIGRITSLVQRLSAGDRWDLVFNIAEGLHGIGRESQVPALLDAYAIPYTFSDPLVCALSLHKGMTKRVIRDLGLPTPAFAVIERDADVAHVNLTYPLFAKPVAEGTSKGVSSASKIMSESQLLEVCRRLLEQFKQPVLVEEYLPGREFTVGIVGSGERAQVVGVLEVVLLSKADAEGYTYENKQQWRDRMTYRLVKGAIADEAQALGLAAWRGLGCRDGGRVDVRADARGALSFIEVNPLPGIHPTTSDLPIMAALAGWSYQRLIERIVVSAACRVHATAPSAAAGGLTHVEQAAS